MLNFSVELNGLTMQCRVFMRTRYNNLVLSGYVNNEQRMECDITAYRRLSRERFIEECRETALIRLQSIIQDSAAGEWLPLNKRRQPNCEEHREVRK